MVFSSFVFLFGFLPLLLLLYFLAKRRVKNSVLLVFSVLFYAWGEPLWVAVLLLSVCGGWIGGTQLERYRDRPASKLVLAFAVAFQILLLFYFKYIGFLLDTLRSITSIDIQVETPGLPIGISFFTFQVISYLIDVYRKEAPALSSFSKLLLYISLFPQLVAGPIVRYADVQDQLTHRRVTLEGFSQGVIRFSIGLGKKVVLANSLSDGVTLFLDGDLHDLSVMGAWFGIILFALQIYFDFSGYSDMAIGLGYMYGFRFRENFDYPYISRSATEFWRRWNMSVGQFFRDYVYIPLGGNRVRPMFNLFVVWFLTGLWHGASWNYVLWGLYFGVFIALEKRFLHRLLSTLPAVVSHLYFLVVVLVGWVLFYFESLSRGLMYLRIMFGMAAVPLTDMQLLIHFRNHLFLLTVACIAASPLPRLFHGKTSDYLRLRPAGALYVNLLIPTLCLGVLTISTLLLVGKTYTPFFYFRF
ncbi:MBOAT family O-acyltransferase [Brevibacillus migulae]|uniref:MBOAT family O-acyltransferase n=1 Tax=Brevibacillus migulae TaxID=1644114 RepID=UPI00106E2DBD|nr:MBOAT family O-acyltransferase [Brevibacillus migulae]